MLGLVLRQFSNPPSVLQLPGAPGSLPPRVRQTDAALDELVRAAYFRTELPETGSGSRAANSRPDSALQPAMGRRLSQILRKRAAYLHREPATSTATDLPQLR